MLHIQGIVFISLRDACYAFIVCGDNRLDIASVPGIDILLCNLDGIHCVASSDPRQVSMSVRITAQAVTRKIEVELTFRLNVVD
jgi:hypothetical protein